MEVAGVVAQRVGEGIQEGDHIVPDALLQTGDVLGIDASLAKAFQRRARDLAEVGPAFTDGELDPQP